MVGKLAKNMSPEEKSVIEAAGERVVKMLKEVAFEVEGSVLTPVKYANGNFKQKTVMGGWNFFLEYAYLGAKGKLIFGLSPEDAQEYEYAEFTAETMDKTFPLAGTTIANAFDLDTENFKSAIDALIAKETKAQVEAEKEAKQAYNDNPLFGAF